MLKTEGPFDHYYCIHSAQLKEIMAIYILQPHHIIIRDKAFSVFDGDVPRRASYGVYISQLIRFARVCNHVTDFNARNKC